MQSTDSLVRALILVVAMKVLFIKKMVQIKDNQMNESMINFES